jgi:hypothetical protein
VQLLKDQFDVLYEESSEGGEVLKIPKYPCVVGHCFRSKYFYLVLQ